MYAVNPQETGHDLLGFRMSWTGRGQPVGDIINEWSLRPVSASVGLTFLNLCLDNSAVNSFCLKQLIAHSFSVNFFYASCIPCRIEAWGMETAAQKVSISFEKKVVKLLMPNLILLGASRSGVHRVGATWWCPYFPLPLSRRHWPHDTLSSWTFTIFSPCVYNVVIWHRFYIISECQTNDLSTLHTKTEWTEVGMEVVTWLSR